MKICVNIPCFNEEKTIASIIARIPSIAQHELEVIVVDDGSTDNSANIAKKEGAHVVQNPTNLGLGRTLRVGLKEALKRGADIIVNIDADGQYNPEDIPRLIQPILENEADLVLANRFEQLKYKMPLLKKMGNRFVSWCVRRLTGLKVKDCQTGFRALNRRLAETLEVLLRGTYTYTQEMLIHAKFNGFRVKEIPMDFNAREDGKSRLISNIFSYFYKVTKISLGTYKDYKPLPFFSLIALIFILIGLLALALDTLGQLSGLHPVPFIRITNDPKIIATILVPVAAGFFFLLFGLTLDGINRTKSSLVKENVQLKEKVAELDSKIIDIGAKLDLLLEARGHPSKEPSNPPPRKEN